jgi:hypothetical protein
MKKCEKDVPGEELWKTSSSRKEIKALSYFESFRCGCSLVWKDISLPTLKGRTLTTRVQIPATAPQQNGYV